MEELNSDLVNNVSSKVDNTVLHDVYYKIKPMLHNLIHNTLREFKTQIKNGQ